MDRLLSMLQGQGGQRPNVDANKMDTSEIIIFSPIALMKMLKHGRVGTPFEVMGLMLGEFIDDYTIRCIDVFAMPQRASSVNVESVDPVFQAKMMSMLKQTGRHEMVVGWYHSHPGFGCWLSSVDMNTQQSFEQLNERSVATVVDPIQSVKGKVVMDSFRLINAQFAMRGKEPRQSTSCRGHLKKPSIQALIHGLNRQYYSIINVFLKSKAEENMLKQLDRVQWDRGLRMKDPKVHRKSNGDMIADMKSLTKTWKKRLSEESKIADREKLKIAHVGKIDPRLRLGRHMNDLFASNVSRDMTCNIAFSVF